MRPAVAALLGLLLTGCFSASDPVAPPESVPPPDVPRVLGGVAICDSCVEVSIDVTGPGLLNVTSATLLSRAPGNPPVRANIDARRFTGDSGMVLRVHVRFTDIVAPGAYDLRLDTPGANAPAQAVVLWSALLVKRTVSPPPTKQPTGLTGTLRLTVSMTGSEVDSTIYVYAGQCGGSASGCVTALTPGVATDIVLPVGRWRPILTGLEFNCTAPGNGSFAVTIVENAVVEVRLDVTCTQFAYVAVSVAAAGTGVPTFFPVACNPGPCSSQSATPGGPATLLRMRPGTQTVWLGSSNPYCADAEGNSRQFQIAPGDTLAIAFHMDCLAPGRLQLGVRFVGVGRDESVRAVSELPCRFDFFEGYLCVSYQIDRGVPAEIEMIGQSLEFQLDDLDPGCTVVGPTRLSAYVGSGQTVELIFDVNCP